MEDFERNFAEHTNTRGYSCKFKDNICTIYSGDYERRLSEDESRCFGVAISTCQFGRDESGIEFFSVNENRVVFYTIGGASAIVYTKNGKKPKKSEMKGYMLYKV